jgi:hypothetical protein
VYGQPMTILKVGDPVIASHFVGPPLVDGVVVATGTKKVQGLAGEGATLKTITVRFADGAEAELDARAVLPGGPNYAVRTSIGESWCASAAEISDAIEQYMTSSDEQKSLAKVAVILMPPGQRTGVGTPLNAADFYVAT